MSTAAPAQPFSVLVADAEDAARERLTEIVLAARPDATVRHADNGRELFAALQEGTYAIIFLDMILPYTDVGKLVRVIELVRERRTSKLVLVSDALGPGWTQVATRLSAYDVLVKPYKEEAARRLVEACAASLERKNVLIVDPSERSRRIVRRVLGSSQFAVSAIEAESGRRALRESRLQDVDIALVDFSLSDMPALEAACQLLARSGDRTSVLMMDGDPERAHAALRLFGISGVILKPFDPLDLDERLHSSLGLWKPYLINALARRRRAAGKPAAEAAGRAA